MNINDMTARYVAAVRGDNTPTARTVAMARAIRQHLEDLRDDDPSEGVTPQAIDRAYRKASGLVKMLEQMVMIVSITVVTSAPPLSPQDAVKVLQASKSDLDRSHVYTPREGEGPRVVVMRSKPGDGPFGPFPPQDFRPLGVHTIHGITYRIPRRAR